MSGPRLLALAAALPCGIIAAALHLALLERQLRRAMPSDEREAPSGRALLAGTPLRLLLSASLIVAPAAWAGGAGALLALAAFALTEQLLRRRFLQGGLDA
ncbi:MAG TPA: hypothetical protein DEA08_27895 [Planctomycetes bacterium]|nr:hypothetical protein [Planctomycetota bacterium]